MRDNQKLNNFLKELDSSELRELEIRLDLMKSLKAKRTSLKLTEEQFLEEFKETGINKNWLIGAHNFNINDIAKIDATYQEILNKKFKEELKKTSSIQVNMGGERVEV